MNDSPDRLLRLALRGNAAFSTLCGVTALVAASGLAVALGVPEPVMLTSLGVQLLIFAGLLLLLASRAVIRSGLALAVVVADVLWVVGTVPLLSAGVLTTTGNLVAVAIAVVIAVFAALQFAGWRRAFRA